MYSWITYLDQEVRSLDVEVVCALEVLFRRRLNSLHRHDARVGDQDVDFAAPGNGLLDEARDLGHVAGVGLDGDGLVAADFGHEGIGGRGVAGVVDDYLGAERGELKGCGGANALGSTGDEGNLAGERLGRGHCWCCGCWGGFWCWGSF